MSRRRGVGVGAIKKRTENAKSFASAGKKMEENQLQHVQEQLETFKVSLQEFAAKHKKQINADPGKLSFSHRLALPLPDVIPPQSLDIAFT